ncbi:polypyrimidine tract-binding protein homolog 3 [Tanacetum coccineum]
MPTTLGEAFSLARITETHFEDEKYPITVEVLHQVFSPHGYFGKVVIFQKSAGVQALIQGDDLETSSPVTPAKEVVDIEHSFTLSSSVEHGSSRVLQLWENIGMGDVLGLLDSEGAHNFAQPNTGIRSDVVFGLPEEFQE